VTTSSDPDTIRREIERTQAGLSSDVDRLTEKVTPGRIVERRVGRARATAGRWRDKVMGAAPDRSPAEATASAASGVRDAVSDAAGSLQDTVQQAPQVLRQQAQGNPIAAGLIAFGAGWLVSSLLPASRAEQRLAEQAKDRASDLAQPLAEQAKQVAGEVQQELTPQARQAAEAVRDTATDAARAVADDGRSAAQDVRSRAQDAAESVRDQATS
jgi:gas vesicle protein